MSLSFPEKWSTVERNRLRTNKQQPHRLPDLVTAACPLLLWLRESSPFSFPFQALAQRVRRKWLSLFSA